MGRWGLVTHAGVIDANYRGEVKVLVQNVTTEPISVESRTRIAQLLLLPAVDAEMIKQRYLQPTRRGEAGFGSTGEREEARGSERW